MASFAEMLDRQAEEIQRPPVLPVGIYQVTINKQPEIDEINSKDGNVFDKITFPMQVQSAASVDEDELESFGKVQGVPLRLDFIRTRDDDDPRQADTDFKLKSFFGNCGLDTDGATMGQLMGSVIGQSVLVQVNHQMDRDDPEIVYTRVGRSFAPDEV